MAYAEFYGNKHGNTHGNTVGRQESQSIASRAMDLDNLGWDRLSLSQGLSQAKAKAHPSAPHSSPFKSFCLWTFTLLICMVVVGFPMLILVVTVGSLAAVTLQSLLPMSAVLVVTGGLIGLHILGVLVVATLLTLRGIYPQDVSWLTWMSGSADLTSASTYASCPLTCDVSLAS